MLELTGSHSDTAVMQERLIVTDPTPEWVNYIQYVIVLPVYSFLCLVHLYFDLRSAVCQQ